MNEAGFTTGRGHRNSCNETGCKARMVHVPLHAGELARSRPDKPLHHKGFPPLGSGRCGTRTHNLSRVRLFTPTALPADLCIPAGQSHIPGARSDHKSPLCTTAYRALLRELVARV